MSRLLLSLAGVSLLIVACKSDGDASPAGAAGAATDAGASNEGGDSAAAGTKSELPAAGSSSTPEGGAGSHEASGGASAGETTIGSGGNESVGGGGGDDTAPACDIPTTVLGSCAKKDLMGNLKSCVVYWGSAFTADALKAACPSEPTLGKNICPSAGSVGVCETPSGATALASYYYNAADATPANQAQCNMNVGHVWCSP